MHTFSVRVQALRDVFQCLKEAIQVHLRVLGAPHHVLIDQVVMRLRQRLVGHGLELGKPLELVACDEVVRFLASQVLENHLSF